MTIRSIRFIGIILFSMFFLFSGNIHALENPKQGNVDTKNSVPSDIKGHWAEQLINSLISKGVVKGNKSSSGKLAIRPDEFITRAEFITLLINNSDLKIKKDNVKNFVDVVQNKWYKNAIDIAISNGIVKGYPGNKFYPTNPITRAEIACLISRICNISIDSKTNPKIPYKDVSTKAWYYNSILACADNDVIKGYSNGLFKPTNKTTRAEAFAFYFRANQVNENIKAKNAILAQKNSLTKTKTIALNANKNVEESPSNITDINKTKNNEVSDIKKEATTSANTDKKSKNIIIASAEVGKTSLPTQASSIMEDSSSSKIEERSNPQQSATTSRGSEIGIVRENYKVTPKIKVLTPSGIEDDEEYSTKDSSLTIEGNIFSNFIKSLEYSIVNDIGKNEKRTIIKSAKPEIVSVVRTVYNETTSWKININPLEEGLNILTIKVEDVFGNDISKKISLIKFVDSDGDGLSNYEERIFGTDPNVPDTDKDGLSDYEEVKHTFTNPLKKDSDGDGISDFEEVEKLKFKTNPLSTSTNGNGISDDDLDIDGDGISNKDEITKYGTDPLNPDTDGDGLSDGAEILEFKTDPTKADSDSNGDNDLVEVKKGKIKSYIVAKALKPIPEYKSTVYDIPENDDLDKQLVKAGDKRVQLILRIQYMINRLLIEEKKEKFALEYTGQFDIDTRNALFALYAVDIVNGTLYELMVKSVKKLDEPKDIYVQSKTYMGYSASIKSDGVKEIQRILEYWRQRSADVFRGLYSVSSLYDNNGGFDGIFAEDTMALLKLFQLHNGLFPSGKINDSTALKLLSPSSTWKVDYTKVKTGVLVKESFGKNMFYCFSEDKNLYMNKIYYSQVFGPWSKQPYYAKKRGAEQNGRVIARNGCGPTSMAMVVANLADKTVDPAIMAKYSMQNDFITEGYETEGALYPKASKDYGLACEYTTNIEMVVKTLSDGKHLGIASMGEGHFTGGGHLLAMMGTIRLPGETFDRVIIFDSNTGNRSYDADGAVVFSTEPGKVFAKPEVLKKEQALGFWLISK